MKQILKLLPVLALLLVAAAAQSQTQFRADLSLGNRQGDSGFYLDLTNHYGVPYDEVCYVRDAGIPEYDVSDVLYVYKHSHYPLRHIVNLRLRGASWQQLYTWCGISRDVYYRSSREVYRPGPPFGNAYGYYQNHGRPDYYSYDRDRRNGRGHRYDRREGRGDRYDRQGDHDNDRGDRGEGHGKHNGWNR